MRLSILIATTEDRRGLFNKVHAELLRQSENLPVQILFKEDRKEISIGKKRQLLLEESEGEYIVYFDSDDWPRPYYVKEIITALESEPDCIGMKIQMFTNGRNPELCLHSLRHTKWEKRDGVYLRNVTHFNPVRRDLALQAGFPDQRFGEDFIYSNIVSTLCKEEIFIDKIMFNYNYDNSMPHNLKYGIK